MPRPQVPWRDVVPSGLFMSLGQFALLYTALAVGMPAGLASLVLQAQVGLTVVIAALALRERPSRAAGRRAWLVGAVGLGVVAVGRAATTPALGLVLVVAAATSWAVGNVVARRASRPHAGRPAAGRPVPSPPRERLRRRPVDDGVVGARRPAAAASRSPSRSTARMPWPTP